MTSKLNHNSAPEPDCCHARTINRRIDFKVEIRCSTERKRAGGLANDLPMEVHDQAVHKEVGQCGTWVVGLYCFKNV
jgi:hypothetical protein